MDLEILIKEFMRKIANGEIEVYNEASLQFELGIFLRDCEKLKGYKIQFERNKSYFEISNEHEKDKHEIDISIFSEKDSKKTLIAAIELKHPRNRQYPESMFSFVKDISFIEQLNENGFFSTYCLTLVNDENFYLGDTPEDKIYKYFRGTEQAGIIQGREAVTGVIRKPTGDEEKKYNIEINGSYTIRWEPCGSMKYYLLKIPGDETK